MDTDKELPGFARIVPKDASLERIACQLQFGEGPVWNARQGYLRWVDIVGDTIWQWTPGQGTSIFLRPSGKANGMTYDNREDSWWPVGPRALCGASNTTAP